MNKHIDVIKGEDAPNIITIKKYSYEGISKLIVNIGPLEPIEVSELYNPIIVGLTREQTSLLNNYNDIVITEVTAEGKYYIYRGIETITASSAPVGYCYDEEVCQGKEVILTSCTTNKAIELSLNKSTKITSLDGSIDVKETDDGYDLKAIGGSGGVVGPQGPQGDKGDKGDPFLYEDFTPEQLASLVGPQGPKGDTGEQGIQGDKGDKGEQGEKGDAFAYSDFTPEQLLSLTGPKGDKGDKGEDGIQGEKGDTGEQGLKGDKGDTGDSGINGQDGLTTSVRINGQAFTQINGEITLPTVDIAVTTEEGTTITYKVVAINA